MTVNSESIRGGKEAADLVLLENWARRFAKPLKGYFLKRLVRPAEADDLVQEVFLRLSKRPNLTGIERIEGYIFQTASSVLTDHFRRDSRTGGKHEVFDEEGHSESSVSLEQRVEARQNVQRVMDALQELPEVTRRVFLLYHLQNLRQKEIAAMLGMPLRTLEKHMSTASRHLFGKLGRRK